MYFITVDGSWSLWSQWSGCGAGLCGGNKKVRTRSCTNPHPSGGGKRCPGNSFQEGGCPGMIATMFLTMLCNRSEMPQSFLFDEFMKVYVIKIWDFRVKTNK